MTKRFSASTRINAPTSAIWSLLTDAGGYADWNSTVDRVEGRIEAGGKVTVHAKVAPGRAFPLNVSELEPERRMVWSGGMPLGLFTGTRTFELSPVAGGAVDFSMKEEFTGLLAPLITRSIPDLQPAFDQFAADLKSRAEKPR